MMKFAARVLCTGSGCSSLGPRIWRHAAGQLSAADPPRLGSRKTNDAATPASSHRVPRHAAANERRLLQSTHCARGPMPFASESTYALPLQPAAERAYSRSIIISSISVVALISFRRACGRTVGCRATRGGSRGAGGGRRPPVKSLPPCGPPNGPK